MDKQKQLVTQFHPYFDLVSRKTKVYFVGLSTAGVNHRCPMSTSIRSEELRMDQRLHYAPASCYCKECDTLWVAAGCFDDVTRMLEEAKREFESRVRKA